MPRQTSPLTATKIDKTKPGNKPIYLFDGEGLYLEITTKGKKLWRFKYRFAGKDKLISFGHYPEISLQEARERRLQARKLVSNNIDPSENRKQQKEAKIAAGITFEVVANKWIKHNEKVWGPKTITSITRRITRDVFPVLGNKPINVIERKEVILVIQNVASRGAIEIADRIRSYCQQIFRYALNNEIIKVNPVTDLLQLLPKKNVRHHPALIEKKQVAGLLRAIDDFDGTFVVWKALQLAPLVFVRPGELRQAEWKQIDFKTAEWRYFITKTKTNHIVPLSRQALEILKSLQRVTGEGKYVFPSIRSKDRPIVDVALLAALRRMGYSKEEMTPHGFRAMARTLIAEELRIRAELIEMQLAHSVKDPNGRAYNRAQFIDERKEMMQQWADYLDTLKTTVFSKSHN